MKRFLNRISVFSTTFLLICLILLFFILPVLVGKGWTSVVAEMLIMSLAACAVNLVLGYGGMVHFGPAGFYGVGAYTAALLLTKTEVPFAFVFISGPVLAAITAIVVGWFCVRVSHTYFAFLTLAFSQLIHTILFTWYGFTGGDDGITGIHFPDFLNSINSYYYFSLTIVIICIGFMWIIVNSSFGNIVVAIRENPERAEYIGIDIKRYRLITFVISAFFLGVAGSLLCGFNRTVFPAYAYWAKSGDILINCLLGGIYNFGGPILGSFLYIFLDKIISRYTEYWPLILGTIIVSLVLFLKGGVMSFVSEKFYFIMQKAGKK